MNPIDKTAPSQTECISFEFKPDQQGNCGGQRYGWKMTGGKLVDLLARVP